jgi:hypothetical protein
MTRKYSKPLGDAERAELSAHAAGLYVAGCTIRSVATQIGRSYGSTHALLLEAGVTLRPRSGRTRTETV